MCKMKINLKAKTASASSAIGKIVAARYVGRGLRCTASMQSRYGARRLRATYLVTDTD